MSKTLTFDFYEVEVSNSGGRSFQDLLQQVHNTSPSDSSRVVTYGSTPIRLQNTSFSAAHYWLVEMIKIRMDNVPIKASLDGETEAIELEDDEGIGEETIFLFDVPTGILTLQRNRYGVSASTLAFYFEQAAEGASITLMPVLEGEALKKVEAMQTFRSFEFRVAAPKNMGMLKGVDKGVRAMMELTQQYEAPHILVQLSMGRGNRLGTLSGMVIHEAKRLLSYNQADANVVERLVVTGKSEGGETKVIDLLNHRMVEKVAIQTQDDRRLLAPEREHAVLNAWQTRRDEIYTLYLPQG